MKNNAMPILPGRYWKNPITTWRTESGCPKKSKLLWITIWWETIRYIAIMRSSSMPDCRTAFLEFVALATLSPSHVEYLLPVIDGRSHYSAGDRIPVMIEHRIGGLLIKYHTLRRWCVIVMLVPTLLAVTGCMSGGASSNITISFLIACDAA